MIDCDEHECDDKKYDRQADDVRMQVRDQIGIKREFVDRPVCFICQTVNIRVRIMSDKTGGIRIEETSGVSDVDAEAFPYLPEKHLVSDALFVVEEGVRVTEEHGAQAGKKTGERQIVDRYLAVHFAAESIDKELSECICRHEREGDGGTHRQIISDRRTDTSHLYKISEKILTIVIVVDRLSGKPRILSRESVVAEHRVHKTEVHDLFFAVDDRRETSAETEECEDGDEDYFLEEDVRHVRVV